MPKKTLIKEVIYKLWESFNRVWDNRADDNGISLVILVESMLQ